MSPVRYVLTKWVAKSNLLIKILFRLHGSYEALKYGTSLDGLSDLTGGIAENIVLQSQSTDISNVLAHLLKLTSIILCKVEAKNADDVRKYTLIIEFS